MIDLSLLEDFTSGAGESLDEMENALLELETDPHNTELLHTIFRAMHTIKGAAQFVGLEKVSALSHVFEDLLDLLRNGKKQVNPEIIDLLIQAKDRIGLLTNDLERTQTEETDVDDLIVQIRVHLNSDQPASVVAVADSHVEVADNSQEEDLSTFLSDEEMSAFLGDNDLGEELLEFIDENEVAEDTVADFLAQSQTSFNVETIVQNDHDEVADFLSRIEIKNQLDSDQKTGTELAIESFLTEGLTATSSPSLPDNTPPSIHHENEEFILPDEEYDQELFGIFIDQLKDKVGLFEQTVVQQFKQSTNHIELLNNAVKILDSLKFSANYMAYESLTHFYGNWIKAINETQKELISGHQVSYDFIQQYLNRLYGFFPQLNPHYIDNVDEKSQPIEKPVEKKLTNNPTASKRIIESVSEVKMVEKPIPQPEVTKPNNSTKTHLETSLEKLVTINEDNHQLAFIEEIVKQPVPVTPQAKTVTPVLRSSAVVHNLDQNAEWTDGEEDLFKRLSSALDFSIEQSIISEPINEIFGAILATTKEEQKYKSQKEVSPKLEVKTLAQANNEPTPKPFTVVAPKSESLASPAKTVSEIKSVPASTAKSVAPVSVPDSVSQDAPKIEPVAKKAKSEAANSEKIFKKSIRVDADKIDSLMNQVGELIVDRAYFFQLANEIKDLQSYLKEITGLAQKDLKPVRTFAYRFSEAIISLGRTSNELQEGVMKIRMLPIAQIFNRYPRLVHDVAHTNGKKVQLEIRGEETELDKMIIEEISDPLIHMIRNAIGHGIEPPEMRKKVGKSEVGTLILEAYHESNHIVIEVTDDGKGIDTERIKTKAEDMGLFTREELNRMSKDEIIRFIMMPGFSTAPEINSTSGRGVGMDVVKKNIEKLNGTIEVESKFGFETKIRLKIPLTLAIIPALLIRVGADSFTIPLANVEETLRVAEHEISIMEEVEVMYLRGKTLPIFRLADLFNLTSTQDVNESDFFVVVVNTGNQRVGLMVDALLGQEEVVIKPLADYLQDKNCFSGATIIGDGRISLILDVFELINMTTDKQVKRHHDQESKSLSFFQGLNS
jgi:two-component system chemotaxis sensor kinase CheA